LLHGVGALQPRLSGIGPLLRVSNIQQSRAIQVPCAIGRPEAIGSIPGCLAILHAEAIVPILPGSPLGATSGQQRGRTPSRRPHGLKKIRTGQVPVKLEPPQRIHATIGEIDCPLLLSSEALKFAIERVHFAADRGQTRTQPGLPAIL
jgi:hypothetical protein